jgi:phage-related protein
MSALGIAFYPNGDAGPVRDYLEELKVGRARAFAKIGGDILILGEEGLRSSRINVRPMGEGLWELKRLYDGVQFRVFFCVSDGRVWLLHAFEKKSAKTPTRELRVARRRRSEIAP